MKELIYIGEKFYVESGSAMSSIYALNGDRYDWGFVNRDLREGKTVTIRPASPIELAHYQAKLTAILRRRKP